MADYLKDNWTPDRMTTGTSVVTTTLTAGQAYPIRLEYTHYSGSISLPHIELQWQPPSTLAAGKVPKTNLVPPPDSATCCC